MAIACKYCIATRGLRGSEIKNLPQTDEEFYKHLESVHHIRVQRRGESPADAEVRFQREHPEVKDCTEPSCVGCRN